MTYKEIQKYIKDKYKKTVKDCWIAHVKELKGLKIRKAWNRKGVARKHPCPDWAFPLILEAIKN